MKYLNLTADTLAAYIAEQYRTIIETELDEITIQHIKAAATGLAETKRWGLIAAGQTGNGKTTLLKSLNYALNLAHKEYDPGEQMRKYYSVMFRTAKQFVEQIKNPEDVAEIAALGFVFIDDLGEEPTNVQRYGNTMTPIIDLIERRYENKAYTFISTNLNYTDIVDKYGARIADRIVEMCHAVKYNNASYRKPN